MNLEETPGTRVEQKGFVDVSFGLKKMLKEKFNWQTTVYKRLFPVVCHKSVHSSYITCKHIQPQYSIIELGLPEMLGNLHQPTNPPPSGHVVANNAGDLGILLLS